MTDFFETTDPYYNFFRPKDEFDYEFLLDKYDESINIYKYLFDPVSGLVPKDTLILNVKDHGVLGTGITEHTAIKAAYDLADSLGLNLFLPPGNYGYSSDLIFDSNTVSILGAGSGLVNFVPVGTAKIVLKPSVFTVDQGPLISGFTVQGNSTNAGVGVSSGDITGYRFKDVVIKDFTGVSSIGLLLDNLQQTERNVFGIRLDNNTIGMSLSVSNVLKYSFEYNVWDIQLLVNDNQIGIQSKDNAFVRGGYFRAIGNVVDAGILMSVEETSSWNIDTNMMAEQTGGVGGQGVVNTGTGITYFRGTVDLGTLLSSPVIFVAGVPTQILGGDISIPNVLTGKPATVLKHMVFADVGEVPTVAMLGAAGTLPPAAVIDPQSNNIHGRFSVGTGLLPLSNQQLCQVTFAAPFPTDSVPTVMLTPEGYPGSTGSAGLKPFVFNVSYVGFWVGCIETPAASQANTVYGFMYHVIGSPE